MNGPVTFDELAALMKARAGLTVDPQEMQRRTDATFADYDLDSLGLLGIVAELEKRYDRRISGEAESCKTPHAFLQTVNEQLAAAGV